MEKFASPIMVTQSTLPPFKEYCESISQIWDSHWLTNQGPLHEKFKKNAREYLKVENVSLFTNGHLALETAIKALNLKGEIITTPFSFASTTHAITNCGLKPVFCDIRSDNYTIDTNKIEDLITERTSAIIPVHVFGYPCDVRHIEEIAKKHKLSVIYDAAHVFGVRINNVGIGEFGDISMFSLHATKVFHSIEGGLLSYKNQDLEHKLDLLKNFGISGPETVECVGINAKMNEFQAAMGLLNLKSIEADIKSRGLITNIYRSLLSDVPGVHMTEDVQNVEHNFAYLPVLIDEAEYGMSRDNLFNILKEYNVFARKYFYPLISDFSCYKETYKNIDLPVAKYVSNRILTLPLYTSMEPAIAQNICEIIKAQIK